MRRRKPVAAFSLFSFQDIVTSVTAILILVMLLLSVELVSRRRSQAASDPEAVHRDRAATVEKLDEQVARLREELATRRSQGSSRTRASAERDLAAAREELEASRRHLAESVATREAAARVRAEKEALAEVTAGGVREIARLEQAVADDDARTARMEKANEAESERQDRRRREIADAERAATELVFSTPASSDRRAWLVELSRGGVTVLLLGSGLAQPLGAALGAGSRFGQWCDGLTPQGDYCLVLERPSADDELGKDVQERLRDRGIPFGIDLVGEDQAVRDGSARSDKAP